MRELVEKLSVKYGWTTDAGTLLSLSLDQMSQLTIDELRSYAKALEEEYGEDGSMPFEHIESTSDGCPIYDNVED